MCEVTLQFYGVLAEITGTSQTTLQDVNTVEGIKNHVVSEYPNIGKHNYIIAVNNKITASNQTLHHGSTIAIMPPFSGG